MAKVLLVEDEAIVAVMAELIIQELGHEVIPAATVSAALEVIDNEDFDVALLDVNICGERVYPVADRLVEKGVPFAFATGYGAAGLEERFRDRTVIPKPYSDDLISRVLDSLTPPPLAA